MLDVIHHKLTHQNLSIKFILYNLANFLKNIITPISLYKLFAYIMMPRKNHKVSRILFVKEAKKIKIKTFRKWLALLNEVKSTLVFFPLIIFIDASNNSLKL